MSQFADVTLGPIVRRIQSWVDMGDAMMHVYAMLYAMMYAPPDE
jgi:hypothetical protein